MNHLNRIQNREVQVTINTDALRRSVSEANTVLNSLNTAAISALGAVGGSGRGTGNGGNGGTSGGQRTDSEITRLIGLYLELERIQQRIYSGNANDMETLRLEARSAAIRDLIYNQQQFTEEQIRTAEASRQVQAAMEKTMTARWRNAGDEENARIRELINYYTRLEQIEQQLAKNNVGDARRASLEAEATAIQNNIANTERYTEAQRQEAQAAREVAAARQKTADARATAADEQNAAKIKELISLYTQLEGIKQKLASGSVHGMGAAETAELQAQANAIRDKINNTNAYSDAQRQAAASSKAVTDEVNKTKLAQAQAADAANGHKTALTGVALSAKNLTDRLLSMVSTMIILRGLRTVWSNMKTYAKDYYDALNEIQVVTLKSSDNIEEMGVKFRSIAKEMSVSSKDVASAATTFYRQGLNDQEVEERLKYTTQYAKIAGIEFDTAAELITASANSMKDQVQGDIERITDVFIYLGDHAGTSAEEVGTAMQKAAASAGQFGVSFEWLGSYIAAVSETTRQAAEVVGTSMNAIIARLHSIKTKGYNEEDETKINDVAKALSTINVALLDSNGNWRDMTDIFDDVAKQWDSLNGKQKSYIATAMAGTRQQNTFFALMNDLSKGLEGGSRAYELYEGAINSTGTTLEKYQIWMESVEAAQNKLTASSEELYNTLFNGEAYKGVLKFFTSAISGLNTMLNSTVGVLTILAVAVAGFAVAIHQAGGATLVFKGILESLSAHPFILATTAIISVLALLGSAIDSIETKAEKFDRFSTAAKQSESELKKLKTTAENTKDMFAKLNSGEASISQYNTLLASLMEVSPKAKAAVDNLKEGLIGQQEAAATLNAELEKYIDLAQKKLQYDTVNTLANYTPTTKPGPDLTRYGLNPEDIKGTWDQVVYNMIVRAMEGGWGDIDSTYADLIQSYLGINGLPSNKAGLSSLYSGYMEEGASNAEFSGLSEWLYSSFENDNARIQQEIKDEAASMVEMFMTALSNVEMPDGAKSLVQDYITSLLAGEDGEISYKELSQAAVKLAAYLSDIMTNGFENSGLANYGELLISQMFSKEELEKSFDGKYDGFKEEFIGQVNRLFELGTSVDNIKQIIKETPTSFWDSLVDQYITKIQKEIAGYAGQESFWDLINWNENWETMFGADAFKQEEIFTKIYNILYKTPAANRPALITNIDNMLANAPSFDAFAKALDGVAQEFQNVANTGEEAAEGVEAAADSATDSEKAVETYSEAMTRMKNEISSMQTIADALRDGKAFDFMDLQALLDQYPDLYSYFDGTAESLEQGLRNKIEIIKASMKDMITESLKTSKEYFQSLSISDIVGGISYENGNVQDLTLKELLGYNEDNEEFVGKIDAYLEKVVSVIMARLYGLKDAEQEAAKTTTDFFTDIGKTVDGIEKLREAKKTLGEDESLSSSDFEELMSLYPQLLNYIGSANELENQIDVLIQEKNEALRKQILDSEELFSKLDIPKFIGIDAWLAIGGDNGSVKTLQGVIDKLKEMGSEDMDDVLSFIDGFINGLLHVDEAANNTEEAVADMEAAIQELGSLKSFMASYKNGEEIDADSLINLIKTYPELYKYLGDTEKMTELIGDQMENQIDNIIDGYTDAIMNSEEVFRKSEFARFGSDSIKTLNQYFASLGEGAAEAALAFKEGLIPEIAEFLGEADLLQYAGKDVLASWQNTIFSNSNPDLLARPQIQAAEMVRKGWEDAGEGIATVFSSSYNAGDESMEGLPWNQNVILSLTPITPDGKVLSPEELDKYVEDLLANSTSTEDILQNDANGLNLVLDLTTDFDGLDEGMEKVHSLMWLLHLLQEAYYGVADAEKTWLEQRAEENDAAAAKNWAETNGYADQINELSNILETEGGAKALETWNSYDETIKDGINDTYPALIKRLREVEKAMDENGDATEAMGDAEKGLGKELQKTQKYLKTKYFKDTAKATKDLEEGTISVTDAYDDFYDECDKVTKAMEDVDDVNTKMANGTDVTASDVSNLATVLGMSAEDILANWSDIPGMMDAITSDAGYAMQALNALNEAAFIRITGTSVADFSALQNGLISVQNLAQDTIDLLIATGQWKVESRELNTEAWVQEGDTWVPKFLKGKQDILVPTGGNPFKSSGSSSNTDTGKKTNGGGGGGGGKDKSSGMTEVERMLDLMEQRQAIQDAQKDLYSAFSSYHEGRGELQGVIGYAQLEIDKLKEQNTTLDENIAKIEEYMEIKRKELAALETTDEEYEEVADDLDKLQQHHQDYTKKLIENKSAIDSLNESIKKQKEAIRDMQIDIRETILAAIQDRENKLKDMFDNEISMENTILDLIIERYEKERDLALKLADERIDALEEEKDLLKEQLDLRKEQAEEEDKLAKLADLESKYARVSADPTRRKDALEIYNEIKDLREEISWDQAEKEVEAQQKAIDEQIESIEDYKEYIENYYQDLFDHPKQLIAEMRDIIKGTDDEIIEWLKTNSTEYAKSSENTQKSMVDGWQETLDAMRGKITTYWDEVEQIIAGGDESIINFLKENSADYAEAGKLQAEKYVDEWTEKLTDLKNALKEIKTTVADTYDVIDPAGEATSSSKGGGGGGGGGGSGKDKDKNKDDKAEDTKHGYSFVFTNAQGKTHEFSAEGFASKEEALEAAKKVLQSNYNYQASLLRSEYPNGGAGYDARLSELGKAKAYTQKNINAYASGGLVTSPTIGLVGEAGAERILNPYQTQLFETMVNVLETIARVQIPNIGNYGDAAKASGTGSVGIETINVNVEHLNDDADYTEIANKVGEAIMDQLSRTSVVGGIRI